MKKQILIIIIGLLLLCQNSYAAFLTPGGNDFTVSSISFQSITSTSLTQQRCRAVWIGNTQSYDFSYDGSTWVTFQGATAGTIIPIQVVGARITSGSASPVSGDIVFLY